VESKATENVFASTYDLLVASFPAVGFARLIIFYEFAFIDPVGATMLFRVVVFKYRLFTAVIVAKVELIVVCV